MTADPAKDAERLGELPPIKTEREQAMRETIEGQGLSMLAMGKELREKDVTIARLTQERDEARRSAEALQSACSSAVERSAHNGNVAGSTPAARTTQPSAADVERAREIVKVIGEEDDAGFASFDANELVAEIAAALTAARREERELRALDEAAIEWAREAVTAMDARAGYSLAHNELRKALAARDAAIRARTGKE